MQIVQLTQPTTEPITLAEAKEHCRVTHDDEDAYIGVLISAARQWIEKTRSVALGSSTWQMTLPVFPDAAVIRVACYPLTAVSSIEYVDTSGVIQTLSTDRYSVDLSGRVHSVVRKPTATWPSTRIDTDSGVRINFTAGYETIPPTFKHAVKIIVAHWYMAREPIITGTIVADVPLSVKSLLDSEWNGVYR